MRKLLPSATAWRVTRKCGQATAVVLLLGGVAYFLLKLSAPAWGLDFRVIWIAGRVWQAGDSAYGSAFATQYAAQLGTGPPGHFWAYPPAWYLPARLIAVPGFHRAVLVWQITNGGMVIGAIGILLAIYARHASWAGTALCAALLLASQSLAVTLSLGQTSCVILLAIALIILGDQRQSRPLLVAGLVLALLKPNIGLPLLIFHLFRRRDPVAAGLATLCYAAASLLPVAEIGPGEVGGFLRATAAYGAETLHANDFGNSTGIGQILSIFGVRSLAGTRELLLIATLILCGVLGHGQRRWSAELAWPAPILTIAALMPLHGYDMMLLSIPAAAVLQTGTGSLVGGFAAILACRPTNIASVTHIRSPEGDMFSDGLILLMATLLLGIALVRRSREMELAASPDRPSTPESAAPLGNVADQPA